MCVWRLIVFPSGKDAQALNKQYSHKILALESEAVQARQELQEAQRQLQDLERQEREISTTDKSRAQECRRKIAAAQSRVQVGLIIYLKALNHIQLKPKDYRHVFFSPLCLELNRTKFQLESNKLFIYLLNSTIMRDRICKRFSSNDPKQFYRILRAMYGKF